MSKAYKRERIQKVFVSGGLSSDVSERRELSLTRNAIEKQLHCSFPTQLFIELAKIHSRNHHHYFFLCAIICNVGLTILHEFTGALSHIFTFF